MRSSSSDAWDAARMGHQCLQDQCCSKTETHPHGWVRFTLAKIVLPPSVQRTGVCPADRCLFLSTENRHWRSTRMRHTYLHVKRSCDSCPNAETRLHDQDTFQIRANGMQRDCSRGAMRGNAFTAALPPCQPSRWSCGPRRLIARLTRYTAPDTRIMLAPEVRFQT